jgi:hypothetical protein
MMVTSHIAVMMSRLVAIGSASHWARSIPTAWSRTCPDEARRPRLGGIDLDHEFGLDAGQRGGGDGPVSGGVDERLELGPLLFSFGHRLADRGVVVVGEQLQHVRLVEPGPCQPVLGDRPQFGMSAHSAADPRACGRLI